MSFPKGDSKILEFQENTEVRHMKIISILFLSILAYDGRGCYIAKADLESAFRIIIPISSLEYNLLGFMVNGQDFDGIFLSVSCSVSCKLFEGLAVPSFGYYRKHSMCRQCRIYWTISFLLTQPESECRG